MDKQLINDMEFLLSFAPAQSPDEVEEGLNPMFYITNTFEGDRRIAQRIKDIRDRYGVACAEEDYG